jgi:hypothetical protein
MNNIWKLLAWLLFGASISVFARLYISPPLPSIALVALILFTVICFLGGAGILSKWKQKYILWRRGGNEWLSAKVGIIDALGKDKYDEEMYSWTDITPNEWKKEIEKWAEKDKIKVKVDLIDVERRFDSYVAVLNPYGGCYPERDIKNFQTLNDIFKYVKKGGLFINVADIPGYWTYNLSLKRRLDATKPIYYNEITKDGNYYKPVRFFELVPFMERLGLRVLNTEGNERFAKWNVQLKKQFRRVGQNIGVIKVDRVVVVERNVDPIIEPIEGQTPFFSVGYGDGNFLMSLIFIGEKNPQNYIIKEIVARLLVEFLGRTIKR